MRDFLEGIPFTLVLMICLTLGLAPFVPEPHIWEKLNMLANGSLSKPIDIFDLGLHGLPWLVLILKISFGQIKSNA